MLYCYMLFKENYYTLECKREVDAIRRGIGWPTVGDITKPSLASRSTMGGVGGVANLSPFWEGHGTKIAPHGDMFG